MSSPSDLNLLFGVLALQLNFVTRDQLVAAMNAWVLEKEKPLGDVLSSQGALSADRRQLLEALLQEHLAQHGGDPAKSLAAVSSIASVRQDLERLGDPTLIASLGHVAAATTVPEPADPFATRVGVVETAAGRYRVLRPHAQGGLGQVSVALDGELNREIALKEIRPEYAGHADARGRFLLEAEVTGGLEHPGIVPVYGLGTYADGRPYYAMRFIKGDSLKESLDRFHGPAGKTLSASERNLEQRKLLGRFVDVCNSVAYAHSRGVLHRDLKPGNVMLGKYGETLLVDWGLAKVVGRSEPKPAADAEATVRPGSGSGTNPTQAGGVVGTPSYMSPEQADGRTDELGPASDVYGLGATLYHLLTGRPPVQGGNLQVTLHQVRTGEIVPPRKINPTLPQPLVAVCLKALALQPSARYASAKELADDIEHYLADEPVDALPETAWQHAGRWMRRHTAAVRSAGVALLAIATAAILAAMLIQSARTHAVRLAGENAQIAREKGELADRNAALAKTESAARVQAEQLAQTNAALAKTESAARREADTQRLTAERETRRANALRLTASAREFADERPVAALGLATDAFALALQDGEPPPPVLQGLIDMLSVVGGVPLRGHEGPVTAAAYSPDGRRIVTASWDGTARIWDLTQTDPAAAPLVLRGHRATVVSAAFSPDGQEVVTSASDGMRCYGFRGQPSLLFGDGW